MFEKSIEELKQKNKPLALLLESTNLQGSETTKTRNREDNLSLEIEGKKHFLHSNYNAEKESKKWWDQLEASKVKLLYIYGIGLGYSFDCLKSWLDAEPDRYVVYFEEDLRVLKRLFNTERGHKILKEKRILIEYLGDYEEGEEEETGDNKENRKAVCEELAYYFVKLPFLVTSLPLYEKIYEEKYLDLQVHLRHKSAYISFASEEFLGFGAPFFLNFYRNMLSLEGAYSAHSLLGKFHGVPAIICGAGPSLNKNFETLKSLENNALIFAGGSALKALTSKGLQPHFGATVDPNPEQYKRMQQQTGYEVPVFFKGRVFNQAMSVLHGPRLYLTGNSCYPITNWLEDKLGIKEQVNADEGNNVLHLTMELARLMGCDPIIFVGMDLAYTNLQLYADQVIGGGTGGVNGSGSGNCSSQVSEEELTKGTNLNNNAFLRDDIYKKPVYTLWKWVAESQYTSQYSKMHDKTTFINATEGGIGVKGVANVSLNEVKEKFLTKQFDLKGQVHTEIQKGILSNVNKKDVLKYYEELEKSLESTLEDLKKLFVLFEDLKIAIEEKSAEKITTVSKEIEEIQERLGDELAYSSILEPVNHIRSILFERKHVELESDEKSEQEQVLDRCQAHRDEIASLREGAKINLHVLQMGKKSVEVL